MTGKLSPFSSPDWLVTFACTQREKAEMTAASTVFDRRTQAMQRILVVDDNEAVAHSLAKLLGTAGFAADVFHRGVSALDHAQRNAPPAAAVVDIHLPDISGLILSRKLREQFGPEVPIIVLSGDTSMETLNSLSHVRATYFLSKPRTTQLLLEQLRDQTASAR
jgi:DNA-binding response OmpR family regulator